MCLCLRRLPSLSARSPLPHSSSRATSSTCEETTGKPSSCSTARTSRSTRGPSRLVSADMAATRSQHAHASTWRPRLTGSSLSLGILGAGECVRCMFWNNLGCIHFAMGKHNLGIFYFKKALQENDHTCAQLGDGSNGQCESSVCVCVCVFVCFVQTNQV